jgi:hypothetical protein
VNVRRNTLLVALGFALLAGALASWRGQEQVQQRLPAGFEIIDLNHLDWNPTTGIFTVTGEDPHGTIVIPPPTFPLDELRLEFSGPAQPGGWYVYAAPEHLPLRLDQDQVVTAVAESTASGHALVWTLDASLLARIDFPDELTVPMQLERARFTSRFAHGTSVIFALSAIAASVAAILILWLIVRPVLVFAPVFWGIAAALLATKLWLATGLGIGVQAPLRHDDQLFMEQALSIAAGDWLGAYDQLTLSKGPTYSVFLALSAATGVSLQFNEVLFHGLACIVFVIAIAPWLPRAEWRLVLLIALLFEPHSMSAELIGRVLRGAIQPALTLFTLAGLVGMVTRAKGRPARLWPWTLLASVAGVAFWFSREEGIWLAPTAILLFATALIMGWSSAATHGSRWVACLILPLVVFTGGKMLLRGVNFAHYGVPIGVDVVGGSFPAAYGAMLRVTSPDPIPGVPITSTTRKLIYPHSPAFAELEWALEGPLTQSWGQAGWDELPEHPRARQEIRGGWFQWALREGAAANRRYKSAPDAEAYWRRVADEINAAVDSGALAGDAPRHGLFPVWQESYTFAVARNWFKALDLVVRFTPFEAHSLASTGDPAAIKRYADFLNINPVIEPKPADRDSIARTNIRQAFAIVGWPLTGLALFATAVVITRSFKNRSLRARSAVLLALWGGAAALILVVTLVHVTSFWAITGNYLGPSVPLIVSCWVLAPVWAWCPTRDSDAVLSP